MTNHPFDTEEKFLAFTQLRMAYENKKIRRKNIRFMLFRIREHILNGKPCKKEFLNNGLREWIENQLQPNLQQNWETFTFTWDVGARDPFTVIIKEQWVQSGGQFDETGLRVPAAFTEQEF